MSRTLSTREKRLLLLCVSVLGLMATMLVANEFLQRRTAVLKRISTLENQKKENDIWMGDRAFWDKRRTWLVEKMPTTESLGRAQGQLLEEIQNAALDRGIQVLQQTLPEAVNTADYREVTVSLRLRGDHTTLLQWLATMQSPERFQAIKQLQLQLDTRAKEPTPQALCNLTLARWFKPENGL